ncbi:MAG: TetR/AcrR family transcriptional regulator [Novosphingobium sp.]|nr:TetR/AcrR family transcriptional regulator [Planctomycetaceae bacterium]MCP5404531.1 TetR/AcrR family transcriptional regulator [Novosphingobium sp.]
MNTVTQPDRRIRKTRKALRLALQHLLLDKPFEQITIRDISNEADIAYTTFFRHYPDKEALLSDLADDEISALLDLTLPMFSTESSHASTLTMCEHVHENERLWRALLAGGAAGNIRQLFVSQVEMRFDQWPTVMEWLPPEISATIMCGVTLDVLTWWLGKAPDKTAEEIAGILDRFFALTAS